MIEYKTIIKGRLDFGTTRSLENAVNMFERRAENYYKQQVLFTAEEVFFEENNSLIVRIICVKNKKLWNNTTKLLDYLSEFAIAGMIRGWLIYDVEGEPKKTTDSICIEPKSERFSTQEFNRGRKLCEEDGNYEAAIIAFSNAIEKHSSHSFAYEWRGHSYRKLGDYEAAFSDYQKSNQLYAGDSEPYLGLGKIVLADGKFEDSIQFFDKAMKLSIPREDVYWNIRYFRGLAGVKIKDWDIAIRDFKFFLKKTFGEGDRNRMLVRSAWFYYGYALLEKEDYKTAANAFDQSLNISYGSDVISEGQKLYYRGLARQKAGLNGFEEDLKVASEQGVNDIVLI